MRYAAAALVPETRQFPTGSESIQVRQIFTYILENLQIKNMSENDPERDLVEETARWHVQLKKAFSCTICLDFRINSVSTKCQHSFCRKCIEGWIETKGTRGRAKCPVCLAGNLTKRSLNSQEEVMGRQIALVKKFFEVEREEMNGELDFLTVKVVNKVAFRTFLESIYSIYHVQDAREAEPSPCKPSSTVSRRAGGVWNKKKMKTLDRKVYGKRATSPEVKALLTTCI